MRTLSGFLLLIGSCCAAQPLLVNEVQCLGAGKGWIELYNAGPAPIPLEGVSLTLGSRTALVSDLPLLGPAEHVVLECGSGSKSGSASIDLELPPTGGTLVLIAPDGSSIMDLFSWRPVRSGASVGRRYDGARAIGYFVQASIGSANVPANALSRALEVPRVHRAPSGTLTLSTNEPDAEIRYSLDGSDPCGDAGHTATTAITPAAGSVFSACAVAPGALASPIVRCGMLPERPAPGLQTMLLAASSEDLWGSERGIDTEGSHANFSRRGTAWLRSGALFVEGSNGTAVTLRIAGSGSRSLPKRNFVVEPTDSALLSVPGLAPCASLTLRADASPLAFLRGCFMEEVVRATGARVEMQPSVPIDLHLNTEDRGLYRAMPTKNADWFSSRIGGGAVDLVAGPSREVLSGSAATLDSALGALRAGAAVDRLARWIDLSSLIDLACFDLYMGRADHDLNVRCWKPHDAEGRWRWLLYDVDLWSLPDENSVERMSTMEADAAPYLSYLLAHPALRERLVHRMTALLNTVLSPAHAERTLDELVHVHRAALEHDHAIWHERMHHPGPEQALAEMRQRAHERPEHLLEALAKELGMRRSQLDVRVDPPGTGAIYIDDLLITEDHARMQVLAPLSVRLVAKPADGMELVGWEGVEEGESGNTVRIYGPLQRVRAVFRPAAVSRRNGLQHAGE